MENVRSGITRWRVEWLKNVIKQRSEIAERQSSRDSESKREGQVVPAQVE